FELPDARYGQPLQRTAFYQRLTERVAALPGVEVASIGAPIPLGGSSTASIYIEGEPQLTPAERPKTQLHFIGQDYLRVLGIPLLRGRALNNRDRQGTPKTLLVSETFARRHFPNEDPLGKGVGIGIGIDKIDHSPYQIVGVIGDVKTNSLDEEIEPASYLSYLQFPVSEFSLVVRTTAPDAVNIVSAVRQEVAQLDRELAIHDIRTMSQLVDVSVAPQRFILITLGLFAGLALLLAAVGIYSVMAYTVTQRTHEIGIRLALGARPGEVLRLLLRQGMRLAGFGAGAGLLAALALARLLKFSLYGVCANDPLTLSAGALLLLGVALVACWIPARRATRVDPMIALRSE
ncbi:MAG: ABC transporter permease, partial [Blastocatellia bacterium]|nr:ABC transporter permease [Blastocatellia bacterium]